MQLISANMFIPVECIISIGDGSSWKDAWIYEKKKTQRHQSAKKPGGANQVIEAQAIVHRCTAVVDFMEGTVIPYPAMVNDETMYKHAKKVGEGLLGDSNVYLNPKTMAAEDFCFYSQKMASTFFFIGIKNKTMRSDKPLRSPYFTVDEEVLPIGDAARTGS